MAPPRTLPWVSVVLAVVLAGAAAQPLMPYHRTPRGTSIPVSCDVSTDWVLLAMDDCAALTAPYTSPTNNRTAIEPCSDTPPRVAFTGDHDLGTYTLCVGTSQSSALTEVVGQTLALIAVPTFAPTTAGLVETTDVTLSASAAVNDTVVVAIPASAIAPALSDCMDNAVTTAAVDADLEVAVLATQAPTTYLLCFSTAPTVSNPTQYVILGSFVVYAPQPVNTRVADRGGLAVLQAGSGLVGDTMLLSRDCSVVEDSASNATALVAPCDNLAGTCTVVLPANITLREGGPAESVSICRRPEGDMAYIDTGVTVSVIPTPDFEKDMCTQDGEEVECLSFDAPVVEGDVIHLVNGPCDAALHGLPIASGAVDAGLQFYPPTADILQSINITVCYLTAESADLHNDFGVLPVFVELGVYLHVAPGGGSGDESAAALAASLPSAASVAVTSLAVAAASLALAGRQEAA